ncbi:substrate-binding protein domain-containing protein [Geodermatophilus amargosae]|uniref:Substrate-binding protein domain-containing protein n=1 Tax=Geodermatophilus amargosae TaxID=1296565 RepID=A0A1I7B498_9ACTN|nr:substrate-binding domain-containing protein [Geodermatophilus amargosae]SFT81965.1 substrate-binding protein domain-containing protein [Geodermatophilus amargosae]
MAVSSALLLIGLAACGSDSDSSGGDGGSSGETDDAAVAAAQERIDPYLNPTDDIPVDVPLTQAPEEGLRVALVRYNNQPAAVYDQFYEEAAEVLNWDFAVYAVEATDPQGIPNGVLRAVSEGVNSIVVQGSGIDAMGPSLAAAKDAGIPVFLGAASPTDLPEGEANGVYGNVMSENGISANVAMADQMIVDSGGTGNAVFVNVPDFPGLAPINDAIETHVAENCSGCSLEMLNISAGDLGGDVASTVVAAVRQNPDVEYVIGSYANVVRGLPQALAAAGLDTVKVFVSQPTEESIVEQVEQGDYAATILIPTGSFSWAVMDQIARVNLGMDPLQDEYADLGMALYTAEDFPEGTRSWDLADYQSQYEELWQLS